MAAGPAAVRSAVLYAAVLTVPGGEHAALNGIAIEDAGRGLLPQREQEPVKLTQRARAG